jgi:CubicO group peptidase (beta-lactamase class C family)
MPRRLRPPGRYAGYSNHGVALAALIIEDVTGQSRQDYVQKNVLTPLGMEMTSLGYTIISLCDEKIS